MSRFERSKILNQVHRVLKPFGYVFVEEFGRTWENPVYAKRYNDDLEVTDELGTITVKMKLVEFSISDITSLATSCVGFSEPSA